MYHMHAAPHPAVQEMVWHSSGGKDWYTLHLALNGFAFVYAAAQCHGLVAAHGAAPIDNLAKSHTISAAYLVALMVVFSGIALDRFIYSVGSTRARAVLLLAEVLLYFSTAAVLMWRSVLDDDNLFHLKARLASAASHAWLAHHFLLQSHLPPHPSVGCTIHILWQAPPRDACTSILA